MITEEPEGAPYEEHTEENGYIELHVHTHAASVGDVPEDDDEDVEDDLEQGGHEMACTGTEQHVVQVGVVGMEGALVSEEAASHDTEGVEDGYAADAEHQGYLIDVGNQAGNVTGGEATVISAMGAGKKAAKSIDEYLANKK